jgi:hypothetical protein
MALFSRKKEFAVQGFVLKLLNTNCGELQQARIDGPRLDGRVNLTVVVMIVPIEKGELCIQQGFAAVTKEFSSAGVAVVLDGPLGLDDVFLGFRLPGGITWLRARAKHLSPMGGGFFQLGFRLLEKICNEDYPQLQEVAI